MLATSTMLKHLALGALDTMKVVLAAAAMAEAMTAEDNIMGLLAVMTKAPKFVTTTVGAGLEVGDNNSFVVDTGSAYHNVFDRSILHHFKHVTGNWTCNNTKCLRTDRGGEFLNNDVVDYCNELGIQLELKAAYASQQNGLAERMHLPIFNKGKKPDISNLSPFGDVAMVMTMPRYARDGKMGLVSVKGRLMGYSKCSKAWRVLLPIGLVSESRDVVFPADKFTEGNLLAQHGNSPATLPTTSSPPPSQHEQDSDSSGSVEDSSTESDFSEDEGDTPHQGQPTAEGAAEGVAQGATTAIRTSSRVRRPPVRLTLLAGATAEESVTLRAADDALKVDWFRGERA
ncbi:hypothetical protein CEUSTIGMA_g7179.t1 [Chlamydomonas eustigma]|uniref:Integrase catalytic domain-containing protein n=1 Tax=Chlamydomonas eustigma TaxID=1157962 RepID=A0A250X9I5_9CHLO|nr:hypothetical protein CEUSTIGMA_g7179.t1 [Chlamydomonas eustigma]|eukprot:GAX79738.1 hypothetical protein CEUSTIGMA_g7179.t1 [Chlamydomonas eustigma]